MDFRNEYAGLLEEIAGEAERMAMGYFRSADLHTEKKLDGSVVTAADRGIEAMARKKVAASGLALEVLGEEMETAPGGERGPGKRARLIIDPVDGTEEFSRGIPTFGTLLGIEREGEIVAAMVSAPALRERWSAYRGGGAFRGERRISVSKTERLAEAMIFTAGTGPGDDPGRRAKLRRVQDAAKRSRSVGGFWQHMLVAEGIVDAAMDIKGKPWDYAPSLLIVEEAGGRATSVTGERGIYGGSFLCANAKLHEEILGFFR